LVYDESEAQDKLKEEWLAWRRQGIGGSDAPIICGINPYRGMLSLYVDKMDRALDPTDPSEAAEWGIKLEPLVALEFQRRTGLSVQEPNPKTWVHPSFPFMIGTPDRFVHKEVGGPPIGILEIKTCSLRKEWDWDPTPPRTAWCQLQHYLAVTGLDLGWLAVLIGGQKFMYHEVPRDERFIQELIEKEQAFWWHVQNDVPPDPDGRDSTTAIINQRYTEARPLEVVELDGQPELVEAVNLLFQLTTSDRVKKQEVDRLKNVLKLALGHAEVGTIEGRPVVSWKGSMRESIDTRALRREAPGIAEQFTRQSITRTFRTHRRRRVDLEQLALDAGDLDDDDGEPE
jgi:putative phage-type endonuclease